MKKLLALPALLLFVIPPLESQQITGKATLNVGTATGAGHYDGTVKVCGGSFCNSSGQKLHLVGPNIFGELGRQTPCTNLRGGDEWMRIAGSTLMTWSMAARLTRPLFRTMSPQRTRAICTVYG